MEITAYTYEADYHCPDCAERRFGRDSEDEITGTDAKGNPVRPVFDIDEWYEPEAGFPQGMVCGTCTALITEALEDG